MVTALVDEPMREYLLGDLDVLELTLKYGASLRYLS
jgi:hypothetical protein